MPLIDVVKTMLQRPVAFQPILGRICGSATAGLMLSQAIYWSERTTEKDGWFYKTHNEWTEEICLSRDEQRTARKNLIRLGFWKEERRGMPNKLFYRIDFEILAQAIVNHTKGKPFQLLENPQQDGEIPTTDGEIPATCEREIPNTMGKSAFLLKEAETTRDYTEITSEVEVTEKTIAVFLLKDSTPGSFTPF